MMIVVDSEVEHDADPERPLKAQKFREYLQKLRDVLRQLESIPRD